LDFFQAGERMHSTTSQPWMILSSSRWNCTSYLRLFSCISYARADSDAADRIVEGLEQAGIRTWRDISEIKPGTEWAKAIESAAKSASAYGYIASSHSSSSSWMEQELLYALSRTAAGLVIVPAIIDDSGPRSLPPFLQKYQWVDFRQDFDSALRRLVQSLSRAVKPAAPAQRKQQESKGYAFISYSVDDRGFLGGSKEFLASHEYGYWDFHGGFKFEVQRNWLGG
jgi:hypothetical protein